MFTLNNKVAIVTGGASGIGKEIATALLSAGARVYIVDINNIDGAQAVFELNEIGYTKVTYIKVDVTSSVSVERAINAIAKEHGALDILINSAGILSDRNIEQISDEEWAKMIDVNLTGVFYCCREAVKAMESRTGGVILNVASAGGKQGFPLAGPHYSATKAAVMALTRQIAMQKGNANIRINSVSPGPIETPLLKNRTEEKRKYMLNQIPLGRFGTPEDVAAVALFLVSDESNYITGENIDVNGGLYMD